MRWRTRFAVLAVPALALGALVVGAGSTGAAGDTNTQSQTFDFTGTEQSFTVPAGVTSITVTLSGGQGGAGSGCFIQEDAFCGTPGAGGNGATVTGTLAVTPGETLTVVTGGAGEDATPADDSSGDPSVGGAGGFGVGDGGSGNESVVVGAGGGGGGASAILRGNIQLAVAAGGGGGGGSGAQEDENRFLDGGNGGASSTAGSAAEPICKGFGGEPGVGLTPGAGGAASSLDGCVEGAAQSNPGGDGNEVDGGNASAGALIANDAQAAGGGGGGGGYAGGGGGSGGSASKPQLGGGGGGGGGSCLAPTGGIVADGAHAGNGVVVISWGVIAAAPIAAQPAFTG